MAMIARAVGTIAATVLAFAGLLAAPTALAEQFLLPTNGDTVIGHVTTAVAHHEDTLLDIGRAYGVGYEEIMGRPGGRGPTL